MITTPGTLGEAFTIGRFLPPDEQLFFDGLIDEVDIYNRALSAEEIAPSSTPAARASARKA